MSKSITIIDEEYRLWPKFALQVGEQITQQVVEQIRKDIFSILWGHHIRVIDKCLRAPQKALFYVQQTRKKWREPFPPSRKLRKN